MENHDTLQSEDIDSDAADAGDVRYFLAGEPEGTWSVYDRQNNQPALMDDHVLRGLSIDDAENLLGLMNQLEADSRPRPAIE